METINTLVAPNGMKILVQGKNSRMMEIAVQKAATAAAREAGMQEERRKANYLRQRAYYERGLANRASRGDAEAIAELARDGLTYQAILNPRTGVTTQNTTTEELSQETAPEDTNLLVATVIIDI